MMVTFASPGVLSLLILLVPYAVIRHRLVRASAIAFSPAQIARGSHWRRALHTLQIPAELIVLALAFVAVAGPGRSDTIETYSEKGLDVALVLDISASMQAADFPPTRLEALKHLTTDFLQRAGGNRVAIHAFAGLTFTQSPLTTDRTTLAALVDGLSYESLDHTKTGGTAIGDALLGAGDTLHAARIEGRDQVVILISDGESNSGVDPLLAARYLHDRSVRLHIIGLGGPDPVEVSVYGRPFINTNDEVLKTSLDDTQLRAIAEAAGGRYSLAPDLEVLTTIFNDLARLERTPIEVERFAVRTSWGPRIAGVTLCLFAVWLWMSAFELRRPLR